MLYQDQTGKRITLGEEVGEGKEGHVYGVEGNPSLVAKVYNKDQIAAKKIRKLTVMLANPPDDPMAGKQHTSIAWPVGLLWTNDGGPQGRFLGRPEGPPRWETIRKLAGFLMPRIQGMRPVFDFYNPGRRREHCPLFDYWYLHWTARNLAAAVHAVHARGYVIGDINESNILVSKKALTTLIDTDSFQVNDTQTGIIYRGTLGKPEFTPPELQGMNFADADRMPEHDLFGLGVAIFQLLMEGTHPFDGKFRGGGDPPNREQRISSGHFPHNATGRMHYAPLPSGLPFGTLNPSLQQLFVRCFVDGHRDPKARPDAQTWLYAIQGAAEALMTCSVNAHHRYSGHLATCPWCERREKLGGRDAFPSDDAVRRNEHLRPPAQQTPKPRATQASSHRGRPSAPSSSPSASQRPSSTRSVASWWLRIRAATTARSYAVAAGVAIVTVLSATVVIAMHRGTVNDAYKNAFSLSENRNDPEAGVVALKSVLAAYPDARPAAYARERIAKLIDSAFVSALKRADQAKTPDDAVREIETVISKYPDADQTGAAKSMIARIKSEKQRQDAAIDAAIAAARGLMENRSYEAATERLTSALQANPTASRAGDAKALLEDAKRGLAARNRLDDLFPGVRRDAEAVVSGRSESHPAASLLSSFDSSVRENWWKAAVEGCPEAQLLMGWCHDLGVGVARDGELAADYYGKAAEQGNAWAQFNLSSLYGGDLRRTVLPAEARAAWLHKSAEQGLRDAQELLGLRYYDGETVAKDHAEAARWFRKAAEQGSPAAQCALGFMQIDGDGVASDRAEAATWFRKAAEQGNSEAQHNLGVMYALGVGVRSDPEEALRWVAKASENEHGRNVAVNNSSTIDSNLSLLRNGVIDWRRIGMVFPDIPESIRRREVWSFLSKPEDQAAR